MMVETEIVARLVAATVLGGVVGYERQIFKKPAGLRTNMLVCLGAALITIYADNAFGSPDTSARVAAGVITGIGFLGAGTIIQSRTRIRGLTTAASMWVVATIGMAVGGRQDVAAVTATVLVVLILYFSGIRTKVRKVEHEVIEKSGKLARAVKRRKRQPK